MEQQSNTPHIFIGLTRFDYTAFGYILQQGFDVSVKTGCTLKSLLCDQFSITPEYIDNRIKTVFLNGKPVDDYEKAIIRDRQTLALSAAMPGLVGATFRSGGVLSPFRSGISFQNTPDPTGEKSNGSITVKLFNLLVKEIGGHFLAAGIRLDAGNILPEILQTHGEDIRVIKLNNEIATPDQISTVLDTDTTPALMLQVTS